MFGAGGGNSSPLPAPSFLTFFIFLRRERENLLARLFGAPKGFIPWGWQQFLEFGPRTLPVFYQRNRYITMICGRACPPFHNTSQCLKALTGRRFHLAGHCPGQYFKASTENQNPYLYFSLTRRSPVCRQAGLAKAGFILHSLLLLCREITSFSSLFFIPYLFFRL
jgi:hypothetical protein